MNYQVFVQGKLFKSFISSAGYSVTAIYADIKAAIGSGSLVVDQNQPLDLRVSKA